MLPEMDVNESALLTDIAMCVNYYRLFSPGLYCCVHVMVELNDGTRWRPGLVVMVNHGVWKQCEPEPDYDCFRGPPNFVLDVFPASELRDYVVRRAAFERAGVGEYVALRNSQPLTWTWNRRVDNRFTEVETAEDELLMSSALPGLWMPTSALRNRDWWTILGAIARGVSRVDHHQFMDAIWRPNRAK